MQSGNFFEWLGHLLGAVIGGIVHVLNLFIHGIGGAIGAFTDGVAGGLGIHNSTLNIVLLVIGLLMLWAGVRALLQRSLIIAAIWIVLALLILGRLITH